MRSSLIFLVLSILPIREALAVYGGTPTSSEIHASIVNIVFERTPCSGVLISDHVVLTAAHCFTRGGKPSLVAHIGEGATRKCNIRTVKDFKLEPNAVLTPFRSHSPDLLLIKIDAPLCDATPATLAEDRIVPSDIVKLAGHGGNEYGHGITSQIEAQVIESSKAKDHVYVSPGTIAERVVNNFFSEGASNYLFALPTKPGATICVGDSGGPVFSESHGTMLLKGINGVVLSNEKLGSSKCDYGYVQVFTPISPYLDWIKGQVLDWESKKPPLHE